MLVTNGFSTIRSLSVAMNVDKILYQSGGWISIWQFIKICQKGNAIILTMEWFAYSLNMDASFYMLNQKSVDLENIAKGQSANIGIENTNWQNLWNNRR